MLSPRNKIEVATLHKREIETVDNLFDLCDSEFNSRYDVHKSFESARGAASWARYFLLYEVRHVATNHDMFCSYHMAFVIATKLSEIWFEQKETA